MVPTIVISAYERVESLHRLLNSLKKAVTGNERILIVIGKKNDNAKVFQIAKNFTMSYPNSEIIAPKHEMGLVDQFLLIGDLTSTEKSVVLLEDDLVVSDSFVDFTQSALGFFGNEVKIGGICLNSLAFNGYTKLPFIPIDDGSEVYFAKVPFFHGQAYTQTMWKDFRQWLDCFEGNLDHPGLPKVFREFPPDEWFPLMTEYLLETEKYFVFPRISYAINFGEIGKHFRRRTDMFQTPIAHSRKTTRLKKFKESKAIYDVFQELESFVLSPHLGIKDKEDLIIDINGARDVKELERTEFVLTTKPASSQERSFGKAMRPLEENVLSEVEGEFIKFTRPELVWRKRPAKRIQFANLVNYHYPMHGIGYKERMEALLLRRLWKK